MGHRFQFIEVPFRTMKLRDILSYHEVSLRYSLPNGRYD